MAFNQDWSKWWRSALGVAPDGEPAALEVLGQRYVEEMQGQSQLTRHADQMHYRQFREKLLDIAADKRKHAQWIGDNITALGGQLPEVPERRPTEHNSWRNLLVDLDEEKRCADRLPEQIWRIGSEHPEISQFLQRIFDAEIIHRQDITAMAMRSDGFAFSLA